MPIVSRTNPDAVIAVATSAVREARNRRDFIVEIRPRFGIDVRVISGDEEARLSYAGARARLGGEIGRATLFDLGGGSLEVIVGDGPRVLRTASAPLGVLRAVVQTAFGSGDRERAARARSVGTPSVARFSSLSMASKRARSCSARERRARSDRPRRASG